MPTLMNDIKIPPYPTQGADYFFLDARISRLVWGASLGPLPSRRLHGSPAGASQIGQRTSVAFDMREVYGKIWVVAEQN
jgi:hypothetical protein